MLSRTLMLDSKESLQRNAGFWYELPRKVEENGNVVEEGGGVREKGKWKSKKRR